MQSLLNCNPGLYHPSPCNFSIHHGKRQRAIKDIKADKLAPYHPWDETLPSTSPLLDSSDKPFKIGTWCDKDSLFIIPLTAPWPFGIGKVIKANDDGSIKYQWYRSENYQGTSPFKPMWWNGKKGYAADKPSRNQDKPYDGDIEEEEWDLKVTQNDIVMHSFELTRTGRVPKAVLDSCRANSDIWWPKAK